MSGAKRIHLKGRVALAIWWAGVPSCVKLEWKLPPDRGAEAGLLLEVVESENMLV